MHQRTSRRTFLTLGCGALLGGTAMCALTPIYAAQVEPHWTEVTRRDILLSGLPEILDGLTIVQLSDLHLGPYVSAEDIRRSVEITNNLQADLVVLTGDFVYHSASYSVACAQELALLRARYGVYAVLGNHDIWTSPRQVTENLIQAGIPVLRNEGQAVEIRGSRLWLLGIKDTGDSGSSFSHFRALWQEPRRALASLLKELPTDELRLLLVHNPDFTEMLPDGRIDLALCGHTHGGQVRLPLIGAPVVPSHFGQKYVSGLVQGPRTLVYTSRGIGLIAPPVRFNCRPEVTLLRLRANSAATRFGTATTVPWRDTSA
jgi:predicted MPP superfamily phosphohydrolase